MSGEYAKLYKRIWGDPDFKTLTAEEQLLFIKLFSQTDVSMAGVLTLATTRWAKQTDKLAVTTTERALKSLEQRGYIVTDPETQEVLIRSYIKNDGGWKSYKTLRGVVNAVRRVLSPRLRAVISGELARIDTSGLRTEPLQSGLVPRDETEREIALLVEENPPPEGVSDGVSEGVSDRAYPSSHPTNTNANANTNAPTNAGALGSTPDGEERKEVTDLCNYLADWIEHNGSNRPTITQTWQDECRRMIDIDKRTPDQIRAAIDWSQQDGFWRANILSMPTLRKKFDQLRLRAQEQQTRQRAGPRLDRATATYLADAERYAAQEQAGGVIPLAINQ